jgi:DNA-binding transcriptional MerR regulator
MGDGARYTIDDVMRLTGVSRRTLRYYVTLGLIPPPDGRGVGLHYRQEHVDAILRVLEAKERGESLAAIAGAERERSQQAVAEPDGGQPVPSAAVDHGVPAQAAAVSADPLPAAAELASRESPLSRVRAMTQRGRCTVESRVSSVLVIPDGKSKGEALILQPGGRAEVGSVTLALANAEQVGLVTVTPL